MNVNAQAGTNLSLIRNALTFSASPITEYRAPPLLGEYTDDILCGRLGFNPTKLQTLRNQGVI